MLRNVIATSGPDASIAGARLTINVGALVANWTQLCLRSSPGKAAAVVKANAYGLGVDVVVPALLSAGCDTFFVAQAHEGVAVRALAPGARIFVICGAVKGTEPTLQSNNLIPLICSVEQLARWSQLIRAQAKPLPYGLHIDTGINRTGLNMNEARLVGSQIEVLKASGLCHIMTHPACADAVDHVMNLKQISDFESICEIFRGVESSFANSAALLTGGSHGADLTRPGIALYGGEAVNNMINPMRIVATNEARVIQIKHAKTGDSVSYGATHTLKRDTTIAVASIGYADGFHRASGHGVALRETSEAQGYGFFAGHKVPILGRVTMDFTMFDVTDVPSPLFDDAEWIEIFGANIALDDAARAAGTIGYEMLTSVGSRHHRVAIG